jgi:hypothetical protein
VTGRDRDPFLTTVAEFIARLIMIGVALAVAIVIAWGLFSLVDWLRP